MDKRVSIFETWDWWDAPWDPNAPWDGQWDVPGHPMAQLEPQALAPALAQPRPDQGLVGCSIGSQGGPSTYSRPVTGGRYQGLVGGRMSNGIPRHYGTMGHPEVPVGIPWQHWTTTFSSAVKEENTT